jgi:hypothetical protein
MISRRTIPASAFLIGCRSGRDRIAAVDRNGGAGDEIRGSTRQEHGETARVLAHLGSTPDVEKEKDEAQFWELYYGELPFVESKDQGR